MLTPPNQFMCVRKNLHAEFALPEVPLAEMSRVMNSRTKPSVRDVMKAAKGPLFQPRCGVGDHEAMRALLLLLQSEGGADLLTLTVDSYTRLNMFGRAAAEKSLNGYPVVFHGAKAIRELERELDVPLQIRHGSPDGRLLAEVSYAAGITAFEGGGISYNLPYCKRVPLMESLRCYQYIDRLTGLLSDKVLIDRETFGSLSAVLVPPSISIAISLIEAGLAAQQGVKCVTISYPQSGSLVQDIAALEAIRELAANHFEILGLKAPEVYTSFHQWMGVFPKDPAQALALIASAVSAAVLGGATKSIIKTHQEALGIPDPHVNAFALRFCRRLAADLTNNSSFSLPQGQVEEEKYWIKREVEEILHPLYQSNKRDLVPEIVELFDQGRLDIPFPASLAAKGEIVPARDTQGRIRYLEHGGLPFSPETLRHNREHLKSRASGNYIEILNDIQAIAADHLSTPQLKARA